MVIKRTTVRTNENLHLLWKITAAKKKITMDEYAQQAIEAKIKEDTKKNPDQAPELRKIMEDQAV